MQSIEVVGSGARAAHGCAAYLTLEVEEWYEAEEPREIGASGTVVEVNDCPNCGEFDRIEVGQREEFEGWIRPAYYGHEGLQL